MSSLKLRPPTGVVLFDRDVQIVHPLGASQRASYGDGEGSGGGGSCANAHPAPPGPKLGENPSLPPLGITGGKVTTPLDTTLEIGVDWLNCTFPTGKIPAVVELLGRWLGREERGGGKGHYSDGGFRFVSGAIVAWAEKRPEAWVSINGDSLELVDDVHLLIRELHSLGCRCSRLDVALDAPPELLPLEDVGAAYSAGAVVGFRTYKLIKEYKGGELSGFGHYFGKRGRTGGGRMVRFYDKTLESRGLVKANRCEAELSAEVSAMWFDLLAAEDLGPGFTRALGRALGGSIDFRQDTGAAHVERRPRLGFWERIINLIGRTRLRVPRPEVPLQRTLGYVKQAFSQAFGRAVLAAEAQFPGADATDIVQSWLAGVVTFGVNQVRKLGQRADALSTRLDFDALFSDTRTGFA